MGNNDFGWRNDANYVTISKEKLDMCLVLRESGLKFYKATHKSRLWTKQKSDHRNTFTMEAKEGALLGANETRKSQKTKESCVLETE